MNVSYPRSSAAPIGVRTLAPLAIVGIGCRIPGGATDAETFWQFLRDGKSGISEIPADRWNKDLYYDPDPEVPRKGYTKWGGFVKDVSGFDADFFNISPREAEAMDPQQRMLLHVVWEALEDAGIAPDSLAGSQTGVFVGTALTDYAIYQRSNPDADSIHAGTGSALSVVSGRVSHRLDLRGPCMSVDTACSSSLTATHLACKSIWDGESEMAIAGGVSVILDPHIHVTFSKANMMSPTGACQTFDADADGYVRAEGSGVVIIKPLSQAVADGDRVYAVIRSTAVNQDGHTSTITVPSAESQSDMLREALEEAGLNPDDVGYIEAHGTGTAVGDPIEAKAIGDVFGRNRGGDGHVIVGSVKSAVGHMEPAAGVVGLIKAALCVYHGAIPGNLNFRRPNPAIPFDELRIEVPIGYRDWSDAERPRIAAVNSFGFGGTNACAIVEQPPAPTMKVADTTRDDQRWVVPLSAANETALKSAAANLAAHLKAAGDAAPDMRDIAATLGRRRAHLPHRLATVARSVPELRERLTAFAKDKTPKGQSKDAPPVLLSGRRAEENRVVFVFCGQGGQWWGMARHLLDQDPVFRAEVDKFDAAFSRLSGWSVIDELYRDEAESRVNLTVYTQPAIFAVQLGLVARWRAWGVEPAAVLGHSFGEVCAGYVSGALTMDDAALIIHHRSNLMGRLKDTGGIAAIGISADHARRTLRELGETKVEIAGVNSGSLVNLAGETEPLQRVLDHLVAEDPDLFYRVLNVDYAPHCFMQEVLKDDLLSTLAPVQGGDYEIPMYSTVTGRQLSDTRLDNDYWWRNARQGVQFKPAVDNALKDGYRVFVEIGPHATLAGLISACAAEAGQTATIVTSLNRKQPDEDVLPAALGTLYAAGVPVDWAAATAQHYSFVDLPGYPWEMKRFWIDSEYATKALFEGPVHPLLGRRVASPRPMWESEIDIHSFRFLVDHKVQGATVYPGTGYLELMLAAAQDLFGDGPVEIEDIEYVEAMVLPDKGSETVQTVYDPDRRMIRIFSRQSGSDHEWTLRAKGQISQRALPKPKTENWHDAVEKLDAQEMIKKAAVYRGADALGLNYGPAFQGVRSIRLDHPVFRGEVIAPAPIRKEIAKYRFHPALFDACMQVGFGALFDRLKDTADRGDEAGVTYLPTHIARLRYYGQPTRKVYTRTRFTRLDDDGSTFDAEIVGEDGTPVVVFEGGTSQKVDSGSRASTAEGAHLGYYREVWEEAELDIEAAPDSLPATWLLLDDGGIASRELSKALHAAGKTVVTVQPGAAFAQPDPKTLIIRPGAREDYDALLDAVAGDVDGPASIGVAHLWSLCETDHASPPTGEDFVAAQTLGANSLLLMAQALAAKDNIATRLVTVSSAAAIVPGVDTDPDPFGMAHAGMNGLARTVSSELESVSATTIDLDANRSSGARSAMTAEILSGCPESDAALRGGRRFVRRVSALPPSEMPTRTVPASGPDGEQHFRVTMDAPGLLDNLKVVETDAPAPGPDEVALSVRAVGLNFRDVMAATGLLPAGAESGNSWDALGLECAGVVTSVGPGVTAFKPGDRVMATARGCLRSETVATVGETHKIPKGIDFEGAATIPSAFMTAYYSLVTLGRLKKGERILIHTATGGVGLAAVQIAQMIGAEIYATAGSPKKRAYLKKLGIKHVMDSRSLDFADEIMAKTRGEGIDMVLNALAGPAIEKGVSVLRPFGRFLEIGKRDVYDNSPIGLKALRKNITFHVIDLANVSSNRAEDIAEVFDAILKLLKQGKLKPLPADVFPTSTVADAFRHMSRARHIGKVVISLNEPALPVQRSLHGPIRFRADSAYLITGGTQGFGLAIADWMAANGAGQLYLMSRSGPKTKAAEKAIDAVKAKGAKVTVLKADVADAAQVDRAFATIARGKLPLRGVIHGAMVLDDAFISQLDTARMDKVLKPKVLGAWNLHRATLDLRLDFFMSMSSMASIFGSAGQGNYVAANSFLDVFAEYRHTLGLPAQTVNWGALGDVGAVSRSKSLQRYMEAMGIPAVPIAESLKATGVLLRKNVPTAAFFKVDWQKLLRANAALGRSPRFAQIIATVAQGDGRGGKVRSELLAVAGGARATMLTKYLTGEVAAVLKADADKIDPERPLGEMGLDSLTSFELKNRIETDLAIDLPVAKFLQKPTISGLSEAVLEKLEGGDSGSVGDEEGTGEDYPLTAQQRGYWRRWKFQPEAKGVLAMLNVNFAIGIKPQLDIQRLEEAFAQLVEKYPILRLRFPDADGEPRGHVDPRHLTGLVAEDASGMSEREFEALFQERCDEQVSLETGPLFQVQVYHRPDDTDVILFKISHTIADAWSIQLLARNLFFRYFGLDTTSLESPEDTADFRDFAKWEKAFLESPEGQAKLKRVVDTFRGADELAVLRNSPPRKPGPVRLGGLINFELNEALTRKVDAYARSKGTSPFTVLMAAYKAHLYALSGQPDIPVWMTTPNRGRRQFHNTIGWLNNVVLVRRPLMQQEVFDSFVPKVGEALRDALADDDLPLSASVVAAADANVKAAADYIATSEITGRWRQFSFAMRRPENVDDMGFAGLMHDTGKRINFGGTEVWALPVDSPRAAVDIGAVVQEYDGKWIGDVSYDPENYDDAFMQDFIRGYCTAVKQLTDNPGKPIEEILRGTRENLAPAAE